jgi:predicted component of type VI protein secretion system
MEYLSLPYQLKKGYLEKAELYDSISYTVGLILSTRSGSVPFIPDFGCDIWEREYSDFYSANKSDIRTGIRNAISKFEKRLHHVSVSMESAGSSRSTLGIKVKITGKYEDAGEEKKFEETYSIG